MTGRGVGLAVITFFEMGRHCQAVLCRHFCHVMNRGRGRQVIFYDDRYNHFLVETPNANLGRIMRHINGVYTQRYKAILIDPFTILAYRFARGYYV